jgi:death-on-curing family protein
MDIVIFFVRTNDFNLRKYKKKIFSQNKPLKKIKKISSNSFSCYLDNKKVEFSIVFEELGKYFLNEEIVNNAINNIVKLSFHLSTNINSSEPIDIHDDSRKKLTNLILLKINNYFSYYINKNSDIFELVAFIEYSLLKNHILINGNKRFAISFLVIFLQLNGFYLK